MKFGHKDPSPKKFANVDPIPVDNPHADPVPEKIVPEISGPKVLVNQPKDIKVKDAIKSKKITNPNKKDLNPKKPAKDSSPI